jgi:hypothetical protein
VYGYANQFRQASSPRLFSRAWWACLRLPPPMNHELRELLNTLV